MDAELKPCPFCGSVVPYYDDDLRSCRCDMCDFVGPAGANEKQAREAWNNRPSPKAAPLVWVEDNDDITQAFISRKPNVFFTCYETVGVGYLAKLTWETGIVWEKCGFGTMAEAKKECQSAADTVFFKLLTGKDMQ